MYQQFVYFSLSLSLSLSLSPSACIYIYIYVCVCVYYVYIAKCPMNSTALFMYICYLRTSLQREKTLPTSVSDMTRNCNCFNGLSLIGIILR